MHHFLSSAKSSSKDIQKDADVDDSIDVNMGETCLLPVLSNVINGMIINIVRVKMRRC